MKKQMIEVEGLPEGWKAKEFRLGEVNEPYYDPATKSICRLLLGSTVGVLIVEKIKPRRIVLEETLKKNNTGNCQVFLSKNDDGILTRVSIASDLMWREVERNDLSLINNNPKLSLGVDENHD